MLKYNYITEGSFCRGPDSPKKFFWEKGGVGGGGIIRLQKKVFFFFLLIFQKIIVATEFAVWANEEPCT